MAGFGFGGLGLVGLEAEPPKLMSWSMPALGPLFLLLLLPLNPAPALLPEKPPPWLLWLENPVPPKPEEET